VRKGLAAAIAAAGLLALPVAADAFVPPELERADAKRFARAWWAERGRTPACYRVGFRWRALPRGIVAAVPCCRDGSSKCVIVFNSRIDWVGPLVRAMALLDHCDQQRRRQAAAGGACRPVVSRGGSQHRGAWWETSYATEGSNGLGRNGPDAQAAPRREPAARMKSHASPRRR
jgi:hypothetical protein